MHLEFGSADISDVRLDGTRISFTVNVARDTGEVNGKTIKGTVVGGADGNWSAVCR